MLKGIITELMKGNPQTISLRGHKIKLEARRGCKSLLMSEDGKPVAYLDLSYSNMDHTSIDFEKGWLAHSGFVLDRRMSWYEDFDGVNDGFTGYSPSWGFFVNEKYRDIGIGRVLFSAALGIARELSRPRPLTRKEIDDIDWEYNGAEPPTIESERTKPRRLPPNQAYFMVYMPRSGFYKRYFSRYDGSQRKGIEYYDNAQADVSGILVFPEFRIPHLKL